ncbi:hypothetical protein Hanom_Chr16g01506911 [Helianthus anomalus]
MQLDLMAMDHSFLDAKKLHEEVVQEHCRMPERTKNYKIQIQNAQNVMLLVEEYKELREKLNSFESNKVLEIKLRKSNGYEAQLHEYELLVNQLTVC